MNFDNTEKYVEYMVAYKKKYRRSYWGRGVKFPVSPESVNKKHDVMVSHAVWATGIKWRP